MSLDWQILEENKKKWYRKGIWRGILISIIIAITISLFININNLNCVKLFDKFILIALNILFHIILYFRKLIYFTALL